MDGELEEETTELYYDIADLVSGQTYYVGLTAFYEYLFESDPIEFEITFTGVDQGSIQPITELHQNYPNPFNPTTTISFSLTAKDAKNAKVEIFNLKGQKMKEFTIPHSSSLIPNQIIWNGTDQNNQPVSSGVYFYKLVSNGKDIASKKMLLLK